MTREKRFRRSPDKKKITKKCDSHWRPYKYIVSYSDCTVSGYIYFIKMQNRTTNFAKILVPTSLVIFTYYLWYPFK